MGAMAFNSKGLGSAHALAHHFSTEADVPHGLANSLMRPHVMGHNLSLAEEKYAEVAQAIQAIQDAVAEAAGRIRDIASSADAISVSATNAADNVQSIAAVAEENSAAVEEVSASAEEMSAQVEETTAQAQELAAIADRLREMVSQFTIESHGEAAKTSKAPIPLKRAA